jgi:transposase
MEFASHDTIVIDGIEIGPGMTQAQAETLYARGKDVAVFVMMVLAKKLAMETATSTDAPATPSSAKPPYEKENKQDGKKGRKKARKKPGAKPGHTGKHREEPERIDRHEERRAKECPDCGSKRLRRRKKKRRRIIIDLPEGLRAEAVELTIFADYCTRCKKEVEPKVAEAMPGCTLGNRIVAFSAWLHYCLGTTIGQIVSIFGFHIKTTISEGGLVEIWHRLAAVLAPWYEQIKREALDSAVLHGDETGWRVNVKTHWLWCFASQNSTFYLLDRSRGSPAIAEFFTEFFNGVLVTDFWAAYNTVACAWRQMCLVHLLRELKKVDKYLDTSDDWDKFRKRLKRLVLDAIRLWRRRDEYSAETYASRRSRITSRLDALITDDWANKNATRLVKRLRKYRDHLFTFLDLPYVPFDNNFAEREIRPAVIMRKNSYCNRSDKGADTQAILMTVFRTLKQRNLNPIDTVVQALRQYNLTSKLPPLPSEKT